jgi:hypothetical protein
MVFVMSANGIPENSSSAVSMDYPDRIDGSVSSTQQCIDRDESLDSVHPMDIDLLKSTDQRDTSVYNDIQSITETV